MIHNARSAAYRSRSAVPVISRVFILVLVTMGLQSCAGLSPGYETPTVTVSSFKALPSDGVMPAFAIGLRVTNPNREALKLQGVAYTIKLDGHEVIKGVGNELPVIEAYGQGEFTLTASANLFAGIRLVTDLLNSNRDTFPYELEAKLDIGRLRPALRVKESGKINLSGATSR